MTIRIYLSNLARYVAGKENGRWVQLPMSAEQLEKIFREIVGKGQEYIILSYEAPFVISDYDNIFTLNNYMEKLGDCKLDQNELTALFKANPDIKDVISKIENGKFDIINVNSVSGTWSASLTPEERYGLVLEQTGHNNLFSQPIPKEMMDYMDFEQIYDSLSINDGWEPVDVNGVTYLVRP